MKATNNDIVQAYIEGTNETDIARQFKKHMYSVRDAITLQKKYYKYCDFDILTGTLVLVKISSLMCLCDTMYLDDMAVKQLERSEENILNLLEDRMEEALDVIRRDPNYERLLEWRAKLTARIQERQEELGINVCKSRGNRYGINWKNVLRT